MRIVSFKVSPFVALVTLASVNPMTRAPSLLAAVSKLRRVRVDGSKNNVATTRPLSNSRLGYRSNSFAMLRRYIISSLDKSAIVTKSCFSIVENVSLMLFVAVLTAKLRILFEKPSTFPINYCIFAENIFIISDYLTLYRYIAKPLPHIT